MKDGYTKKELAQVAGYSYRRLFDIDNALPQGAKLFVQNENGRYDLPLFVQRWVKYNLDSETAGDEDLETVKAIHERVKTRKTELEVAQLEGKLVDVQEVRNLWAGIANTVMQNFLKMPHRIAPQLTMLESADIIAALIDAEVRTVLTGIANTPLPEVAKAEESLEDEEA